jgi:hypothetical protein
MANVGLPAALAMGLAGFSAAQAQDYYDQGYNSYGTPYTYDNDSDRYGYGDSYPRDTQIYRGERYRDEDQDDYRPAYRHYVCDSDGDRCYRTNRDYWDYREYYRRLGYHWDN